MARYKRFEDLPVWQEAERLYGAILDLLEGSPKGLSNGFRNRIDRASLSVSNNIAEGFERMFYRPVALFFRNHGGFGWRGSVHGGGCDQTTTPKPFLATTRGH